MEALSPLQKFESKVIARSAIKNAAYNPRRISPERRARLRTSLEQFGLVQAPVWNERTGNLVGGHRRIEEIDSLSPSAEYSITVNAIDVSPGNEKALNVVLNSTEIGGEFDEDLLQQLLDDIGGNLSFDLNALICHEEKKGARKIQKALSAADRQDDGQAPAAPDDAAPPVVEEISNGAELVKGDAKKKSKKTKLPDEARVQQLIAFLEACDSSGLAYLEKELDQALKLASIVRPDAALKIPGLFEAVFALRGQLGELIASLSPELQ